MDFFNTERDKFGCDDMVMLQTVSKDALLQNLNERSAPNIFDAAEPVICDSARGGEVLVFRFVNPVNAVAPGGNPDRTVRRFDNVARLDNSVAVSTPEVPEFIVRATTGNRGRTREQQENQPNETRRDKKAGNPLLRNIVAGRAGIVGSSSTMSRVDVPHN